MLLLDVCVAVSYNWQWNLETSEERTLWCQPFCLFFGGVLCREVVTQTSPLSVVDEFHDFLTTQSTIIMMSNEIWHWKQTELQSFIRGHHVYIDSGSCHLHKSLVTVSTQKMRHWGWYVVWYVTTTSPSMITATAWQSLALSGSLLSNKVSPRVHRSCKGGGGYVWVEVLCKCRSYGPKLYVNKMEEIFQSLVAKGLI